MGFFSALGKTRAKTQEVAGKEFADLQTRLILADTGMQSAADIIRAAKGRKAKFSPTHNVEEEITARLQPLEVPLILPEKKPFVIMVMGVNGGGKTTTIAKLCRKFALEDKKVLLAAGDTFRAAAREQLQEWAGKLGDVALITAADPGAAAFDGAKTGAARDYDVVLIDTAGRLPSQPHLMAELGKIRRAADKALPGAPHELLLVLDATTGRNALQQIETFSAAAGVTGLVIAKLDGSAKAGFLLELAATSPCPVRFAGTGEGADDLQPFNAAEFAKALLG